MIDKAVIEEKIDRKMKSKRKAKEFYRRQAKRQRSGQLFNEIAGGGFLVFCCGNRERESSEEIKNLLDEFTFEEQGNDETKIDSPVSSGNAKDADDPELDLERELEDLRGKEATVVKKTRRIRCLNTGCKGVVFAHCPWLSEEEIVETSRRIYTDVEKTGKRRVKHIARLVPVQRVCAVETEAILSVVERLLSTTLNRPDHRIATYAVACRFRNSDSSMKGYLISEIGHLIKLPHTVKLKSPDALVVLEAMKNVCCVSVVDDAAVFNDFKIGSLGKLEMGGGHSRVKEAPAEMEESKSPRASLEKTEE